MPDKSAVRFSEDRREGPEPTYRIVLIDDGVDVDHGGDWAEVSKMVLEPRADLGVIWAMPRVSRVKDLSSTGDRWHSDHRTRWSQNHIDDVPAGYGNLLLSW